MGERVRDPYSLSVGDRVSHSVCGPGTVDAIDWEATDWRKRGVSVAYDKIGAKGVPWKGRYDEDWFAHANASLDRLPSLGDERFAVCAGNFTHDEIETALAALAPRENDNGR